MPSRETTMTSANFTSQSSTSGYGLDADFVAALGTLLTECRVPSPAFTRQNANCTPKPTAA
jgi:hypothetical protein